MRASAGLIWCVTSLFYLATLAGRRRRGTARQDYVGTYLLARTQPETKQACKLSLEPEKSRRLEEEPRILVVESRFIAGRKAGVH